MAVMNTHVSASFSDHIHSVLKKQFLDILRSELMIANAGVKETHPQHMGNTGKWNRWADLSVDTSADALTEGVTPDGDTLTSASVSYELVQYGKYVTIADFFQMKAINDTKMDAVDILGRWGAALIERLAVAELQSGGTQRYTNPGSNSTKAAVQSGSDIIQSSDLLLVTEAMRVANVRPYANGKYRGYLNPRMEMDLLAESDANDFIILASNAGENKAESARIGTAYGLELFSTTEVIADSISTNTYGNIFLGDRAFASIDMASAGLEIITKGFGEAGTADPLNQRATVGCKFVYDAKVLQQSRAQILWAYSA